MKCQMQRHFWQNVRNIEMNLFAEMKMLDEKLFHKLLKILEKVNVERVLIARAIAGEFFCKFPVDAPFVQHIH